MSACMSRHDDRRWVERQPTAGGFHLLDDWRSVYRAWLLQRKYGRHILFHRIGAQNTPLAARSKAGPNLADRARRDSEHSFLTRAPARLERTAVIHRRGCSEGGLFPRVRPTDSTLVGAVIADGCGRCHVAWHNCPGLLLLATLTSRRHAYQPTVRRCRHRGCRVVASSNAVN